MDRRRVSGLRCGVNHKPCTDVTMRILFVAVFLASVAGSITSPAPMLHRVEAWVHSTRKVSPYSVAPGITAVVVSDGGVHMFGDGVQRLGEPNRPAEKDTLMNVGSISKTFIALGLATLVTKGELQWSDRVQKFLGKDFKFGPSLYVSKALTVKDLLAHRTGLAEGQGEFITGFTPLPHFIASMAGLDPFNTLRDDMAYSNTGWILAGEVLRAATNSSSWCRGLHKTILQPLNLTRTYCHRNELPEAVAAEHLAAVHKMDPCRGAGALATYDFVATGKADDFAWGAADASGAVISSVVDLSTIVQLLLGDMRSDVLAPAVLNEMLTAQMITPPSWNEGLGLAGWADGARTAGLALGVGLGFDIAGEISLLADSPEQKFPYAEKSGDTDMHKARLGVLTDQRAAVLLLSNLGGSAGGPLTAMKFGVLALLAGGTEADADAAAARALNVTGFWKNQWGPLTTCTACGAAAANRICSPGGYSTVPLPLTSFAGEYGAAQGGNFLRLSADSDMVALTLGPLKNVKLKFSNNSAVVAEKPCAHVASVLTEVAMLAPWANLANLTALPGNCTLVEWILPPEVPSAGISASEHKVAFPWGCGYIPLPDGPSIFTVAHGKTGVLVSYQSEALWKSI